MAEGSYLQRALAAYYRRSSGGTMAEYPSAEESGEETVDGKQYVVVRSGGRQVLSIYRITNQDALKRLKRWPEAFKSRESSDRLTACRCSSEEIDR